MLRGLNKKINRSKQKMLIKMGKAESTIDTEYENLAAEFEGLEEAIEVLLGGFDKYIASLKGWSEGRQACGEAMSFIFKTSREEDGEEGVAARALSSGHGQVSGAASVAVSQIEAYGKMACAEYLKTFGPLRQDMKVREKCLLDYDRFRTQLAAMEEKGAKEAKKMKTREQMGKAKSRYDVHNQDVTRKLRLFFRDRKVILAPVFRAFAKAEHEFLSAVHVESVRVRTALTGEDGTRVVHLIGTNSDGNAGPVMTRSRSSTIPVNFQSPDIGTADPAADPAAGPDTSSGPGMTRSPSLDVIGSASAQPELSDASLFSGSTPAGPAALPTSTTAPTTASTTPAPVATSPSGLLPSDMASRRDAARARIPQLEAGIEEMSINLEIFEPGTDEHDEVTSEINRLHAAIQACKAEEAAMEAELNAYLSGSAADAAVTAAPPPPATAAASGGPPPKPTPPAGAASSPAAQPASAAPQQRVILVATRDFVARVDDHVSMLKGDTMIMAAQPSASWYQVLVQRTNEFGLVPAQFVERA